jgi:protein gp37
MAKNSDIEWTHHTANPWWGNDNPRKATKSVWRNLLTWQAEAAAKGEQHRVFVGSMMDIFEKPIPLISWHGKNMPDTTDDLRQDLFHNYVPACPNLLFLFLTKRPSNIGKYIPKSWKTDCPTNVMFGTSASDQKTYNYLVPQLIKNAPGRRFLSIEPQIGYIDPIEANFTNTEIHWIIQGGESGPGKRPFNILWAYDMQKACAEAKVPYFFKQIDKVQAIPKWALVRQFPNFSIS